MTEPEHTAAARSLRIFWITGLLLVVVVTVLCLVPARNLPGTGVNDKIEHGLAYLVLALWFAGITPRRDYFFLLLALVALGGGIEIAQGLMGLGRTADTHDLLADGLGAVGGLALALTPLGRWATGLESVLKRLGSRRR